MPFYTFILDYKGGTYISQIEADSTKTACLNWSTNLDISEIYGFGKSAKERLIARMEIEEPVLLDELTNV